jgi:predicted RNA-binding Zn-ribbon protein involved in translation (DUF1610 family)
MRIWAGILVGLQRLLPCMAIPTRCPSCNTPFQLTREDLFQWGEDFWVQGLRHWQCPDCGQTVQQGYKYLTYLDSH